MEQFVLVAIKGPANSVNIGWKTAEGLENVKPGELKKIFKPWQGWRTLVSGFARLRLLDATDQPSIQPSTTVTSSWLFHSPSFFFPRQHPGLLRSLYFPFFSSTSNPKNVRIGTNVPIPRFLPFFLSFFPPPPFFPLCFWFFAIFKSIVTRLTNWLQASLDCDFKREESIQSSALLIPFRSLLLRPSFSIATGTARITSFLTRVFLSFFSPILNSRQRESYSV